MPKASSSRIFNAARILSRASADALRARSTSPVRIFSFLMAIVGTLLSLAAGQDLTPSRPTQFTWGSGLGGSEAFANGPMDSYIVSAEPLGQPQFEPFGTDWIPQPFSHNQPNDPARTLGLGDPLVGTSWRNRPLYVGWMYGALFGDELIGGRVEQDESIVGGYRIGWDFDHYWGTETRFTFAHVPFSDSDDPTISRTSENFYWDVDVLYYPWGDSRWRPYMGLGLGIAHFDFTDANNQAIDKSLFMIPVSGGVKYYWKNWLALRLSVVDNWAIGRGALDTMHNLTVTGDVEIRFGGRRVSYFPYHGSLFLP